MENKSLKIQDAAKLLGVSIKTLQRWEAQGFIRAERTPGSHRRYSRETIEAIKRKMALRKAQSYAKTITPLPQVSAIQQEPLAIKPEVTKIETTGFSQKTNISPKGAPIFKSLLKGMAAICLLLLIGAGSILAKPFIFNDQGQNKIPKPAFSKDVLAAESGQLKGFLNVNVPAFFNDSLYVKNGQEILGDSIFIGAINVNGGDITVTDGSVFADNLLYTLTPGDGIEVEGGQTPTITNTGVLSFQGQAGDITLTAGTGISISGTTITNSSPNSDQNIFKTFVVGSDSVSAGSTSDSFEFEAGTGISLALDTSSKILTITGNAVDESGFTDDGTDVRLTTITDNVGIGIATPSEKLHVVGNAIVTGSFTLASDTISDITGDGLALDSGSLEIDLLSSSSSAGLANSRSGLELNLGAGATYQLSLLQGCQNGQILKWDAPSGEWACSSDVGGQSQAVIAIQEGTGALITGIDTLRFTSTDFDLGSISTTGTVSLDASIARWDKLNGAAVLGNTTLDILAGGTSTASAKFGVLNLGSGTPTASISANSGNNAAFLTGAGNLGTTNSQTLTLGGSTTGNITLNPLNGNGLVSVNGELSLTTGNTFQINGTDVLSATTLGSAVVNSSLTSVGTIGTGIWQGTAIAAGYGGTGIDSSGSTGVPTISSGTWSVAAQLSALRGGTGVDGSSASNGQLLIGNGAGFTLATLTAGTGVQISNGSGTITISQTGTGASKWTESGGVLYPNNEFLDVLLGGTSTSSAKFGFLNISSGTPTASVSAGTNGALYLTAGGNLATTLNRTLTLGGSTTGNITLDPLGGSGLVISTGDLNLASGKAFQINGTSVLSSSTLGSGVTNSSLQTLGTISSGTWNATAIAAQYGGTGINTSASTGVPTISSGTWSVAAQLSALRGGTGVDGSSASNGQLLIGNGAGYTLATLTAGSGISVSNGSGSVTINSTLTPSNWTLANGALSPNNSTVDVLLGGTASNSAKFGFINIDSGTPTASISANSGNIASFLTGLGNLGTTNAQTLTLGGASTGEIILNSGSGLISLLDNTSITGTLSSTGTVTFSNAAYTGNNSVIYGTSGTGVLAAATTNTSGLCLQSGASAPSWSSCPGSGSGGSKWTELSGLLFPNNSTVDVLFGGSSTSSAKFAFTGVSGGTPTASISANSGNNALFLTGNGNLATTNSQTLTIGGTTTGNLVLNSGSGLISLLDNTSITGALSSSGSITFSNAAYTSNNSVLYGTSGTGVVAATTTDTAGLCLQSGASAPTWSSCPGSGSGGSKWTEQNGLLFPNNSTLDVLFGGTASSSAKFAFTGVSGGTPTASISANSGNNALSLAGNGVLGTTNKQTLSLGNSATGDINLVVNSGNNLRVNGAVGITDGSPQCVTTTNGIVTGTGTCQLGSEQWVVANGSIYTGNPSLDLFLGGTSTASAKFSVLGISSDTPVASVSATSGSGLSIGYDGSIQTTRNNTLTVGGNTTGNISLNPLNGNGFVSVNGELNLTSGNTYQINGTDVLSATTLGTNVVNSSLQTVGTIGTGIWQGTAVGAQYGGTGINTSASTGVPTISSGTWSVLAQLSTALGGLGGNVTAAGAGEILYSTGTTTYDSLAAGNSGECLVSGGAGAPSWTNCAGATGISTYWGQANGTLYPSNSTVDLLLGGQATTSAKFGFLNVNSGTPTASISANSGNNALYLTGTGNLATTNRQTLTLGGSTTGNIAIDSGSGSITLSDNTTLAGNLILAGSSDTVSNTVPQIRLDSSENIHFDTRSSVVVNIDSNNNESTSTFSIRANGATTDYVTFDQSANMLLNNGSIYLNSTTANDNFIAFQEDDDDFFQIYYSGTGSSPNNLMQIKAASGLGGIDTTIATFTQSGRLGIGTDTPTSILDIRGNSGTLGVATVSGNTSFASFVANNNGVGDIFTASKSGATKFTIQNNGNIQFFGTQSNPITLSSNATAARSIALPDESGTICLQSSTNCGFATGTNYWQAASGTLSPINSTLDFALGGTSTSSAKFAVLKMNSGTPTATLSGNLIVMPTNGAGGNVGIGTISPSYKLDLLSRDGTQARIGYDTSNYITMGLSSVGLATFDAVGSGAGFQFNDAMSLGVSGSSNGSLTFNSVGGATAPSISADSSRNLNISAPSGQIVLAGTGNIVFDPSSSNIIANLSSTGDFFIQDNGTDFVTFTDGALVGIGTTSPASAFQVTRPLTLGATGKALAVLNQIENQDIFAASASGNTRFVISNNGNLQFTGSASFLTTLTSATGNDVTLTIPDTGSTDTICLLTLANCTGDVATNYWQLNSNLLSPANSTYDFAVGGDSTISAQFAITGISSDTPVATLSGSTGTGLVLDATNGSIQSLLNGTLTLGGNSTGTININELVNLGSNSTGIQIATSGTISDIDGDVTIADNLIVSGTSGSISGGQLYLGTDDTTAALGVLYGSASGNEGAELRLHLSADFDSTFESWNIDAYQDDLRIFRSDAGVTNTFTAEGQLQLPVTGVGGGLLLGGDANLYRSAANILATSDDFVVGGGDLYITGQTSSSSTTEGTLYYDTDDDQLKVYANGKWQSDRTTATVIVGTSNTTNGTPRNYEKADFVCSTSDCDTAIESAISALPTNGGIVVLLEGYYVIDSDGIEITKSNVALVGSGRNTILRRNWNSVSSDGIITVGDGGSTTVTGVRISNLAIDGNDGTISGSNNMGIYFNQKVSGSVIENNYIYDTAGSGIYLSATTTTNNRIINNDLDDVASSGGDDIDLASATDTIITGNNFTNSNSFTIFASASHNNVISNNKFSTGALAAVYLSTSNNNVVSNNNLNNMAGGGANDSIIVTGDNNTIIGNDITDTAGTGYAINISGSGAEGNYLSANRYSGTGATRISDTGTSTVIQHANNFNVLGTNTLGHLANISGESIGKSLVNLNYTGTGQNILTASSSGATKFALDASGNISFAGGQSSNFTTLASDNTQAATFTFPDTSGVDDEICLLTLANCTGGATTNYWQLNSNALSQANSTFDVLFGGTSTASAKFAFLNNAGGTPTASISANSGNNATFLTGAGVLGTTNRQTLTLGGSTTGDIALNPRNSLGNIDANLGHTGTFDINMSLAAGNRTNSYGFRVYQPDDGSNSMSCCGDDNALMLIQNADGDSQVSALKIIQSGSGSTANGIVIQENSGSGAGAAIQIVSSSEHWDTGIDISDTTINTGIYLLGNSIQWDGIEAQSLSSGSLTFEDTSSNALMTLTDNGTTGSLSVTGGITAGTGLTLTAGGISVGATVGNSSQCLKGGATASWGSCGAGASVFEANAGAIVPTNSTYDFLLGGTATSSAKFGVLNMNSGTPTASISANSGNNALFLTGTGNLATTNKQTLTLGGSTTGNIALSNNTLLTGSLTGYAMTIDNANSSGNGLLIDAESSSSSQNALYVTTNNGAIAALRVAGDGRTKIGGSGSGLAWLMLDPPDLTISDGSERPGFNSATQIITLAEGQALGDHRQNIFNAPFISGTAGGSTETVTNASTLYIDAAPSVFGGNAAITNAYSLFVDDGVTRLDGNVGIGGVTTPTATLDVAGAASVSGSLNFRTGAGAIQTTANNTLTLGGSKTGDILLNSDGNNRVGIGTTNPLNALSVEGDVSLTKSGGEVVLDVVNGSGDTGGYFRVTAHGPLSRVATFYDTYGDVFVIHNNSAPSEFHYGLYVADTFYVEGDNASGDIRSGTNTDLSLTAVGDGEINLFTDFNTGINIGTSSNTPAPLSVSGGIGSNAALVVNQTNNANIFTASASGTTRFTIANNGNLTATGLANTNQANAVCYDSTTGAITYNSGSCSASSQRFKHDIVSIDNLSSLEKVMDLRPVNFRYNRDYTNDQRLQLGFIAEEVNLVDPTLVDFESDGITPSGVKYMQMSALLTAAMKEQQGQIEEIQNSLNLNGTIQNPTFNDVTSNKLVSNTIEAQTLKVGGQDINETIDAKTSTTAAKLADQENQLGSLLSDMQTQSEMIASLSARINTLEDSSVFNLLNFASSSANFVTVADDLLVLGNSTFNNAAIVDTLSIGNTLQITGSSIDTIGETLALQPLRQGALDIMGGAITIDTDGKAVFTKDVRFEGIVEANIIKGIDDKLTVSGSAQFDNVAVKKLEVAGAADEDQSAGVATLEAGETEIVIDNSNVTSDSLIFLTPTSGISGQSLFIKAKSDGQSFTVGLPQSVNQDIEFNYLIIN